MINKKVVFPCSKLDLEGVLSLPGGNGPFPAVIVCHPHPLYGGSMDNNVVNAVSHALVKEAIIAFRFNFRGVGNSEGSFDNGIGEQEDVTAAINYLAGAKEVDKQKIGLSGYSAGAAYSLPVALKDNRIKALAAISPPLGMFDFNLLKGCTKPRLLITGSEDDFIPAAELFRICEGLSKPGECVGVDGADHFWWGFESQLAGKVASFFKKTL